MAIMKLAKFPHILSLAVFAASLSALSAEAQGLFKKSQTDLENRIGENRLRFEQRQLRSGRAIPAKILADCAGIVILHHVKAGFVVGADIGNGVALVKNVKGEWGAPAFMTMSKGSWGLQIGANESVTIIVLMTPESLKLLKGGGVGAGINVEAVAGPLDAGGDLGNVSTRKPVLVYSSAKGAYAGASVQAGSLVGSKKKNMTLYGATADHILFSGQVRPTPAGEQLIEVLNKYSGR